MGRDLLPYGHPLQYGCESQLVLHRLDNNYIRTSPAREPRQNPPRGTYNDAGQTPTRTESSWPRIPRGDCPSYDGYQCMQRNPRIRTRIDQPEAVVRGILLRPQIIPPSINGQTSKTVPYRRLVRGILQQQSSRSREILSTGAQPNARESREAYLQASCTE